MYLVLENRKIDFVLSTLTNNSVIKLRNKSVLNPKVSAYHISELQQKNTFATNGGWVLEKCRILLHA